MSITGNYIIDRTQGNLGGLQRNITVALLDDVQAFSDIVNGNIAVISLTNGIDPATIDITAGELTETQQAPFLYEYSLQLSIPRSNITLRNLLQAITTQELIVIATDNNNQKRLLGEAGNGARVKAITQTGQTPEAFNSIQLQLTWTATYPAAFANDAVVEQAPINDVLVLTSQSEINLYDTSINIQPGSLTYSGTSQLTLLGNSILCTAQGTVSYVQFTDTNNNQYKFPCAELSGWTIHDVLQAQRAIINNYNWLQESGVYYNITYGYTLLDNGVHVPYNEQKQKIYTDL